MSEVYLENKYVGTVDEPRLFVQKVKDERRRSKLDSNVNVYFDDKRDVVELYTGRGRARRPLIVVKNGQPLLTEMHVRQLEKDEISWSDLIGQGVIEYVDAAEEENCFVHTTANASLLPEEPPSNSNGK